MGGNLGALLWESRSKLGDAQGSRRKNMPQFQPEVPDPLRDQLPAFLPPRLKGAAMQVQFDHIAGGESLLWEI